MQFKELSLKSHILLCRKCIQTLQIRAQHRSVQAKKLQKNSQMVLLNWSRRRITIKQFPTINYFRKIALGIIHLVI